MIGSGSGRRLECGERVWLVLEVIVRVLVAQTVGLLYEQIVIAQWRTR